MKRAKLTFLLLLLPLLLLSACSGQYETFRLPDSVLPPVSADIVITPLGDIAESSGGVDIPLEIRNDGAETIRFAGQESPAGVSFALMKYHNGAWEFRRPAAVATASAADSMELLPGETRTVTLRPNQSVGSFGKGSYRFYCFFTPADAPDASLRLLRL